MISYVTKIDAMLFSTVWTLQHWLLGCDKSFLVTLGYERAFCISILCNALERVIESAQTKCSLHI